MFLAAPKMVSFSQLPAVKKDTIFDAGRKFFGPSYFVMALMPNPENERYRKADAFYKGLNY